MVWLGRYFKLWPLHWYAIINSWAAYCSFQTQPNRFNSLVIWRFICWTVQTYHDIYSCMLWQSFTTTNALIVWLNSRSFAKLFKPILWHILLRALAIFQNNTRYKNKTSRNIEAFLRTRSILISDSFYCLLSVLWEFLEKRYQLRGTYFSNQVAFTVFCFQRTG